jgi:uncharacterized MAPEG superfamily protein
MRERVLEARMTTDLWMLVASVALTWLLIVGTATPSLLSDPKWAAGNRDEGRDPTPGWHARLRRTSANMNENLVLFAALVLVANVAGKANATTALGAEVFFGARVAHAIIYVGGVPYLRTLAWAVSIVGMFMIASALV